MAFKAGSIYGEAFVDTKKWDSGLKSMGKGIGIAAAAIGAAFVAGMTKAIGKADEFQKAMSNVASITDESTVSTNKLAKQVLALDPALGGATELTKGLYQSFSSGASTAEEAMQTTIDSATFAKAVITDTATAVDVLTTAVNAYGKENMTTTHAADLFFKTVEQGKITGEQLAGTIGQSIPLFASTGIELEQLTAGLAAMTKQGVKSSEATTQLNGIINAFLKPSEEMSALLTSIGIESGSAFLKTEGLTGALKLLEQQTAGDAAKMAELLPNIRALRGGMALTGVGGQEFTRVLEEMENATGSATKAFEEQEKTFDTFKNASEKVLIVIGNIGKFFIDGIARSATTAAQSITQFLQSAKFMEILSNVVGYAAAAFELLRQIVEPIATVLFNTFGEIISAIINAISDMTGHTDGAGIAFKVLAFVINLTTSALKLAGTIAVATVTNLKNLILALKEAGKVVGSFFEFLAGKKSWSEVKEQASAAGEAFKNFGIGVVDGFKETFKTAVDEVKTFFAETDAIAENMRTSVTSRFDDVKGNIVANWDQITTGFAESAPIITDAITTPFEEGEVATDEYVVNTTLSIDELRQKWFDHYDELLDNSHTTYDELKAALKEALDQGLIDITEFNDLSTAAWEKSWNAKLSKVENVQSAASAAFSASLSMMTRTQDIELQNQQDRAELDAQAKLAILDKQFDDELITKEEYETKKAQIDDEAKKKVEDAQRAAFENKKKADLAGVAISAAAAIMGWWKTAPQLGPIAGPIFATAMTLLTGAQALAQASAIQSQQFVPAREKGGMASGLTRINEAGGEIISLPDGSQVVPNDISRQIAANSGMSGTVINVYFKGAYINNDMDLRKISAQITRDLGRQLRLS